MNCTQPKVSRMLGSKLVKRKKTVEKEETHPQVELGTRGKTRGGSIIMEWD